jgi:hypothetical protein
MWALSGIPRMLLLAQKFPKLANIDLARITLGLDADVVRITSLVDSIFSIA